MASAGVENFYKEATDCFKDVEYVRADIGEGGCFDHLEVLGFCRTPGFSCGLSDLS